MRLGIPGPRTLSAAAENSYDKVFRGGVADLRPMPSDVIDVGPQRTVHRYRLLAPPSSDIPVLLVPPLAAPTSCFDLRRGCSLAEHLTTLGYPLYLVDYGRISFDDRALGLEHWVEDVIPKAAAAAMADLGADRVQIVGWCLGGIMSLLSVADGMVPAASVATVASPFDFTKIRVMAPIRTLAGLTRGAAGTALYRMMGGAPAPLVSVGFRLSSLDKTITKPFTVATHLHDRDFLAQIEAVDAFMGAMIAYPGRTFGQLYHRFFRINDLHDGHIDFAGVAEDFSDGPRDTGGHGIDLADVDVPVLSVAGESDVLAPPPAVHHVGSLLTGSPDVRLETAPGGHLGVLTGRSAERTTWRALDAFLLENGDAPQGGPDEAVASAALPAAG